MWFLPMALAQNGAGTASGTARPVPKLVLTNSLDAFTTPAPRIPTNAASAGPATASKPATTSLTVTTNAQGEAIWAEGDGIRITASAVGAKVSRAVAEAAAAGAGTMVIGVANRGGRISPDWKAVLIQALEIGRAHV